eukprot:scaffold1819_cov136-Isochrysis_galbana.AAC.1
MAIPNAEAVAHASKEECRRGGTVRKGTEAIAHLQVVRFALGKKYVGAVEAELPAARIAGRTARNRRPNFIIY